MASMVGTGFCGQVALHFVRTLLRENHTVKHPLPVTLWAIALNPAITSLGFPKPNN